jgi:oligoribonuclease NrnB/cAMP/cGMP phosphodiesterase (DHH superfamily)
MKVLIVSHESDLDGLFSAAIGLIRYPQARTLFLGYGKESLEALQHFIHKFSVSSFSEKEEGLIIICDLALNDDRSLIQLCKGAFTEAKNSGSSILWLDHHPWADSAKAAIEPFVEIILDKTGNRCASEIVYEKFLLGNELAYRLGSMAHSMDFFSNDQYLPPLAELIIYYHNSPYKYVKLSSLAEKVSRGILWDVDMQNEYALYCRLQAKAKDEAYQTMQLKQIGGRFRAAFIQTSPYIQSSLFAHEVFGKTNSDLVMLYGKDNKVSIRRNNNMISCRRIAQRLSEGGGHDFAAGARFRSDPTNRNEITNELEEAILKSLV